MVEPDGHSQREHTLVIFAHDSRAFWNGHPPQNYLLRVPEALQFCLRTQQNPQVNKVDEDTKKAI